MMGFQWSILELISYKVFESYMFLWTQCLPVESNCVLQNGALCNCSGEMTLKAFEMSMRKQIGLFLQVWILKLGATDHQNGLFELCFVGCGGQSLTRPISTSSNLIVLFCQRQSTNLLAMEDLSEMRESHLETLKMVMASQQRLQKSMERIQVMICWDNVCSSCAWCTSTKNCFWFAKAV